MKINFLEAIRLTQNILNKNNIKPNSKVRRDANRVLATIPSDERTDERVEAEVNQIINNAQQQWDDLSEHLDEAVMR